MKEVTRPKDCSICRRVTDYLRLKEGCYWVCQTCFRFLERGDN